MDCREDLEFHDDSSRAADRAKESILLMKKKMLRSHDLILQYNNKLKECERLKGELCTAQEDAAKLKKDHTLNLMKVVKLESQIADNKRNQLNLEKKIADQDVRIAGDKSHIEQLICKLEGLESKHSGMLIEADIHKSSLEGKIKELELEFKKLQKLQRKDAENPERCKNARKGKKSLTNSQIIKNETVDVGTNTAEEYIPQTKKKLITVEKSVLTDEFYHTSNNPYPIFCDRCEALTVPSFEKFYRVMTDHPPMLTEIQSPQHPQISSEPSVLNNTNGPEDLLARKETQEYDGRLLDAVSPEIENLKRKITTLEHKMKKRNKLISRNCQALEGSCCGHAHQANCWSSRGSSHAVPPVLPNVQPDFMAEFWKRIMTFSNEPSPRFDETGSRLKRSKKAKFNKRRVKISTKRKRSKCASNTNWEIESDECGNEGNDSSQLRSRELQIPRLKPRENCDEESTLLDQTDAVPGLDDCENSKTRRTRKSSERLLRKRDKKISPTELSIVSDRMVGVSPSSEMNRIEPAFCSKQSKVNFSKDNFKSGNAMQGTSRINRSDSISPSYDATNQGFVKRTAELPGISQNEEDFNDPGFADDSDVLHPEHHSEDEEPSQRFEFRSIVENSRKRKRTISPLKAPSKSVKSKLLGKLRALKKNSKTPVTAAQRYADEQSSRSLSRMRKISNESETECGENSTRTDERFIGVTAKRQRIAHVPKNSISKECETESPVAVGKQIFLSAQKSQEAETLEAKSEENSLTINTGTETREIQRQMLDDSIIELNLSLTKKSNEKLNAKALNADERNELKIHSVNGSEDAEENRSETVKVVLATQQPVSKTIPDDAGRFNPDSEIAIPAVTSDDSVVRDTGNEKVKSSALIEESPASPDASQTSYLSDSCAERSKIASNSDEPASIYEKALLLASTSMDGNSINSEENAAPVHRNLIQYDTAIFEETSTKLEEVATTYPNSESIVDNYDPRSSESNISVNMHNIVKDLRTRQVRCTPKSAASAQSIQQNFTSPSNEDEHRDGSTVDPVMYQRGIRSLGTLLTRHIAQAKQMNGTKANKLRNAAALRLQAEAEKTVKNELVKLIESKEWSNVLHKEVTTRISQIPSRRTVAKVVVDFLVERALIGETLDRTYTPPAPVMTRTQQRIIALINSLEREPGMAGVFELVRTDIDFNLFRLGYAIQVEVVEYLVRMLTVMSRMRKDRESVRILCCDVLYFLGSFMSNAIYVVLSIWPEVFPMHGSRRDPLVDCIVHLLRVDQGFKSMSIKRLLKDYYKYPDEHTLSANFATAAMNMLRKEYTDELEISILLVSKKERTEWAYKHIVNGGLLNIVEDSNYPFLLNALRLLGFILRTFPTEDEDKTLATMIEKLCTMLKSSEGLPDKEEGIVSALLSLSRCMTYFSQIADTILKWKPSRPMCSYTIEQLNSFFKLRSVEWWNKRKSDKLKLNLINAKE